MKDIFVDNNIAKNFASPKDIEYKKFINWLIEGGFLVASKKLINEYNRTCSGSYSHTSITVILNKLISDKRIRIFKNQEINNFKHIYFKSSVRRVLRSGYVDREYHIPTVLMSNRKYALVNDNNLQYDLVHFPGFTVLAEKRPENLPYDS